VRKENTEATWVRQSAVLVDDEAVEEVRCGQVRPEGAEVVLMAGTRKLTWRLPARLAAQQLPFALSLRLAEQQLQSTASELTGAKTVMAV
jgi:hypothetical protein